LSAEPIALAGAKCWSPTTGRRRPTGILIRRFAHGFAAAALLALAPVATAGASGPAAILDDGARADISRIETYLNRLKTVRARFLQVSSTGEYAEGSLYLNRPGKLRIDYEPPVPVEIIADGSRLIYHDRKLEQVTYLPLGSTPAGIFVKEKVSLNGGELTVTDFARGPKSLRVTVVRADEPLEGSLTLVFGDRPLELRKWSISDAQGTVTNVSLMNARFGVPLDDKLFRFRDPYVYQSGG